MFENSWSSASKRSRNDPSSSDNGFENNALALVAAIALVLGFYCCARYICCRSSFENPGSGVWHTKFGFRNRRIKARSENLLDHPQIVVTPAVEQVEPQVRVSSFVPSAAAHVEENSVQFRYATMV